MIVDDTWRVARLPLPQRLLGKAMAWGYRLIGKDRYDDFRLEWVYGLPFMVTPSVFNPKVPRTGQFFASRIDSRLVSRESEVLDMGTGSGVCAVFAANHARRVVAVDINPAAVRCARINALLNNLDHKIEVRHGDLFAPVAGERFDLILFNPPFLCGTPRDAAIRWIARHSSSARSRIAGSQVTWRATRRHSSGSARVCPIIFSMLTSNMRVATSSTRTTSGPLRCAASIRISRAHSLTALPL